MQGAAALRAARPATTPQQIGHAATLALYDELALSPKPGLVTLIDNGSHSDMDARTFVRSLFGLRSYFPRIAALGQAGAPFDALQRCGIDADARMLAATGGINTHRGAVFMLGLLCASAGALVQAGGPLRPDALRAMLLQRWGHDLAARAQRPPTLPGGKVARQLGLRGASQEAAAGFPVLFETAVPALSAALARGLAPRLARLDTLFHVMAVLDDSNLALRGGIAGLHYAQDAARGFLTAGGAARSDALQAAAGIGRAFVARRLSPGGAADTVAAACWLQRVARL
jgi:triphosphoribosyl-dephospho-CoA synthase